MRTCLINKPKYEVNLYSHPTYMGYELGLVFDINDEHEREPGVGPSALLEEWDPWKKQTGKHLMRTWHFSIDLIWWTYSIEFTRKYT